MLTTRRNPAEPGYYWRKLTARVVDTVAVVDRVTVAPSGPLPGGGSGGTQTEVIVHASDALHVAEYTPNPGGRVLVVPMSTQAQRDLAKPTRVLVLPLVSR